MNSTSNSIYKLLVAGLLGFIISFTISFTVIYLYRKSVLNTKSTHQSITIDAVDIDNVNTGEI